LNRNKADKAGVGALMTETIPLTPQTGKPDDSRWSNLPIRLIDLILIVALAIGALLALRLLLHPRKSRPKWSSSS